MVLNNRQCQDVIPQELIFKLKISQKVSELLSGHILKFIQAHNSIKALQALHDAPPLR